MWVKDLIENMGYLGLVFLMFLENVFPPIPSELIMPMAGFLSGQGKFIFPLAVAAGTLGSVLGALPLYYAGKLVGQERLEKWAEKHGRWLTVSPEEIRGAQKWFEKHGTKAVLIGRLIPGVRSLLSIPAGITKMNLAQFLIYTAIGSGIWSGILGGLGLALGKNYETVEKYLNPVSYGILGLMLLIYIYRVVTFKNDNQKGDSKDETDDYKSDDK